MKRWLWLPLLLVALAAGGCATSQMREAYKNHQYQGGPIRSLLVVGVAQKYEIRKAFELLFSRELAKAGFKAIPSYKALPPGRKPDARLIKDTAARLKLQAVMVVHYRGVERRDETPKSLPPGPDYSALPRYYPSVYHYVNRPGYNKQQTFVQLECNLYETSSQQLIWSGHSEILNPKNLNQLTQELAAQVTAQLEKDGLAP